MRIRIEQCDVKQVKALYKCCKEMQQPIRQCNLKHYLDINEAMYITLIDWLYTVSCKTVAKYSIPILWQSTCFLVRHYLHSHVKIPYTNLQLLGAIAFAFTSNFYIIGTLDTHEIIYLCANAYTLKDIQAMTLKFAQHFHGRILCITPAHFIQIWIYKREFLRQALYYCNCALVLWIPAAYQLAPPVLAGVCIYLARRQCNKPGWPKHMQNKTGLKVKQHLLKPILKLHAVLLSAQEKQQHKEVPMLKKLNMSTMYPLPQYMQYIAKRKKTIEK